MKKYFLGIIAVSISIACVAFSLPSKSTKVEVDWRYNLSSSLPEDLKNFANWSQSSTSCTPGSAKPCIVPYESSQFSTFLSTLSDGTALSTLNGMATSKKP